MRCGQAEHDLGRQAADLGDCQVETQVFDTHVGRFRLGHVSVYGCAVGPVVADRRPAAFAASSCAPAASLPTADRDASSGLDCVVVLLLSSCLLLQLLLQTLAVGVGLPPPATPLLMPQSNRWLTSRTVIDHAHHTESVRAQRFSCIARLGSYADVWYNQTGIRGAMDPTFRR